MPNIVAALELNEDTPAILGQAARLTRAMHAKLYLLHIEPPEPDFVGYEPGPEYIRESVADDAKQHHQKLHGYRDELRAQVIDVDSLIIQGPTAEKVVEEARKLAADYLIVGSQHHSLLRHLFYGNVTEKILSHAPCPVLVVPVEGGEKS